MTKLSIIMYHYVREIKKSKYPGIKGLEINDFKKQLEYLESKFNIITPNFLIAYILGEEKKMPNNACLLSFDDGYKDHIQFVLPELMKRKLKACFFPVVSSIKEKKVLDVNAIHYILAFCKDINKLIHELKNELKNYKISDSEFDKLWKKNAIKSKYDKKEIIFFKRVLQRELKIDLRRKIIKKMFLKFTNMNFHELNKELYMTSKDLNILFNENMNIGNHTYNHSWLSSLDKKSQEKEISNSLSFLAKNGLDIKKWIMCYPYGSYNENTLQILKKNKCIIGLTTKHGVVNLNKYKNLELERIDTNEVKY